jgi:hypothetical protein
MATNDSPRTGFRIANGPLVSSTNEQRTLGADFAEPPPFSPAPLLFATARDPHTLFVYWDVDWSGAFAAVPPLNRQAHLRIITAEGPIESESVIEPLLGTFYAPVSAAGSLYRAELGYYDKAAGWQSIATSDTVTMPPDSMSEDTAVDVATLPFHLSFQRLIDLFRESNGDPLATLIARVQQGTIDQEGATAQEQEILRAMDLSLDQLQAAHRGLTQRPNDEMLRKRAEAILGFGATSPRHGFGGSSWPS